MKKSTEKKKDTTPSTNKPSPKTDEKKSSEPNEKSSKPNEKSSEESQVTKTETGNKSASQSSISHFSSVSTPEYREGWNRIFGAQKKESDISSKKSPDLKKVTIFDKEMTKENIITVRKIFKDHALKKGFDTTIVEELMTKPFSLEYTIEKK